MKTLLVFCLMATVAASQTVETGQPSRNIIFADSIHGDWLTVHRADKGAYFDPSFTCIISDFIPIVHKLPSGKYEIVFTSELTKNLP